MGKQFSGDSNKRHKILLSQSTWGHPKAAGLFCEDTDEETNLINPFVFTCTDLLWHKRNLLDSLYIPFTAQVEIIICQHFPVHIKSGA